jgi:hypothetical protein
MSSGLAVGLSTLLDSGGNTARREIAGYVLLDITTNSWLDSTVRNGELLVVHILRKLFLFYLLSKTVLNHTWLDLWKNVEDTQRYTSCVHRAVKAIVFADAFTTTLNSVLLIIIMATEEHSEVKLVSGVPTLLDAFVPKNSATLGQHSLGLALVRAEHFLK